MKIIADENIPYVEKCFSSIGQVETLAGSEIKPESLGDADVLLVRSVTKVNAELLAGSDVKFVATATIGVDNVDTDYLRERGIGFASAPGSNAESVAEYVVAALLNIAEGYGFSPEDKTIGIIGVGNVGSKVASKARGLGMEVILNDPPLKRQTGDRKYRPLDELFDCDILSLHTPLTMGGPEKTFHLADGDFFDSCREDVFFINTARGAVADTDAVKNALAEKKAHGAVIDVWENEPDIDIELLKMVDIATPHIAGYSLDGKVSGMIMIYEAVCEYLGLEPQFGVNSFLPEPEVPLLELSVSGDEVQDLLAAVNRVYDIREDDRRLKKMADVEPGKRKEYFRRLRKEYPVRREFGNTKVRLGGEANSLAKRLKATGFEIADEK